MSWTTLDGNEAAARVAHRASEVIAIYPITPSSTMGELADEWSAKKKTNVWGDIPRIMEMQSEAGAAGAIHGALSGGALATTFTASQGLLLMIPDMYKIAGELTPFVMHVAARALATHALSIFGDHADVMACRQTGFALLASSSVQEAHDLAAIAHSATLKARVPFLHFFDGFRTSHEVAKIQPISDEQLLALLDPQAIAAHRARALSPDHPTIRGTAQNPDVFFQSREASNSFYDACPGLVKAAMAQFASVVGRKYDLFDYVGHPEAERVIVIMGSGAETADETVRILAERGERVGVIKVRLYRPFDIQAFIDRVPKTVKAVAAMDRTKEPGAPGDPLWLDVLAAFAEARRLGLRGSLAEPVVSAGRYGLSSKEFTPAMVKAIFDDLGKPQPKGHFTIGIEDDVTHLSLPYDSTFTIESDDVVRALFFGLGSDGTVGSNKNTIKIIGEDTDNFAQGYFVYDSRKSGTTTVSHVRLSPKPIRAPYLINEASFVGCHHWQFLDKVDVLEPAKTGATLLLNAPWTPEDAWDHFPKEVQQILVDKHIRVYVVDADHIAEEVGLGHTLGTIMQACFFALSNILPRDVAIQHIKESIQKSYGKRGEAVVKRNFSAVDLAVARMVEIKVPAKVTTDRVRPSPLGDLGRKPSEFVEKVTSVMLAGRGESLPVSAFLSRVDGTWPTGTAEWEKRSIALSIPQWDPAVCIQCNKCALICPHAAIRTTVYQAEAAPKAPAGFVSTPYKGKDFAGQQYVVQVAPDDCTGCGLCVEFCPAKDKSNPRHKAIDMVEAEARKPGERTNYHYYLSLPPPDRKKVMLDVKGSQFLEPLFEYSGACGGCGETSYVKLLSQLFGDRAIIANATGCSSIYGGNLPTTPWRANAQGRGPAWSNSLFEDNAEFGLGIRLAVDALKGRAERLLQSLAGQVGDDIVGSILNAGQHDEAGIEEQRVRIVALREKLASVGSPDSATLSGLADYLVRKCVWIVGGDGWAYDIGYGGLDHVIATGLDVNILVLDTAVYSNTGGQQSKATPTGASAKFASSGKEVPAKDLALLATTYGNAYVARLAVGAKDKQTVDAFREAESWHGPSLLIAYSHCIAHGYNLVKGPEQQRLAVDSGLWPLFRYDPRRAAKGEPPLQLDSGPAKAKVIDFMRNEGRFRSVELADAKRFARLAQSAQNQAEQRMSYYQQLAGIRTSHPGDAE
ncbi:MAG: pyruvate:ferredoxin (flavodoxin) oxidoreductase [Polyangiaceae bacterium]